MPWPKWPRPRAGPDHGHLMHMVSEPKFNLGSQNLFFHQAHVTSHQVMDSSKRNLKESRNSTGGLSLSLQAQEIHSPKPNSPSNNSLHQLVWANWTIIYLTTGMCHVNIWKKFVFLFFLLCCSKKKRYHTPSYGNDFCSKGEAATKQRLDGKKLKTFSTFIWCVKSSFFRSGKVEFKSFKL